MSEKIITFVEFELERFLLKNKKFGTDCNIPVSSDFNWECSACRYILSNNHMFFQKYSTKRIEEIGNKFHRIIKVNDKTI